MAPVIQTIEAALADVMAEHRLTRIDCGMTDYAIDRPYVVSIWFDAPVGIIGHAAEHGKTLDEALAKSLSEMTRKLALRAA